MRTTLPAQLCIARHGETDWNAQGVLQGWIDVEINQRGRAQAFELAEQMNGWGFSAVYSSPLARSLETARIIAGQLQLPDPICHDGIKERYFGVIQGIPKSELAELNPILFQQISSRNPACHFEQGETTDQFADRVLASVMDIASNNAGTRILIITHGWVMDVITRHISGLPRSAILHMKRKNGECLWLKATRESICELHWEAPGTRAARTYLG